MRLYKRYCRLLFLYSVLFFLMVLVMHLYNTRTVKETVVEEYLIQNSTVVEKTEYYQYTKEYEYFVPDYINTSPKSYRVYVIDNPEKHRKKIYTEYTMVTDKSSEQYTLLNLDANKDGKKDHLVDEKSGVRVIEDQYGVLRYCIAIGSYWANGEIGRLVDVVLDNGCIIPCITCDVKQDEHTMNNKGMYGNKANDVVEFYICPYNRNKYVDYAGSVGLRYKRGDVSTAREEFDANIIRLIVWDDYLTGFEK